MCESFFTTLECELLDRCRFRTQVQARIEVFEFTEGWYNPHRSHSALDYLSPINYERTHDSKKLTASPPPSHSTGVTSLEEASAELSRRIDELLVPFVAAVERLITIPGVQRRNRRSHGGRNRRQHEPVPAENLIRGDEETHVSYWNAQWSRT